MVSVSRRALPPHFGQVALTNAGTFSSGLPPSPGEGRVRGQHHRQLGVRHRLHPVLLAVDDRDGCAPVALAADEPVLEAVGDRGLAEALRLRRGRPSSGSPRRRAGRRTPRCSRPAPGRRTRPPCVAPSSVPPSGWITTRTSMPYLRANSKSRWSWAGTDMIAPGAVAHEDEVADPDRDLLAAERVVAWRPVKTPSFSTLPSSRARRSWARSRAICALRAAASGRPGQQAVHHRVLGGEDHEGRAAGRVDAGGEDADRREALDREVHLGAGGLAHPVLLLDEDALRPGLSCRMSSRSSSW